MNPPTMKKIGITWKTQVRMCVHVWREGRRRRQPRGGGPEAERHLGQDGLVLLLAAAPVGLLGGKPGGLLLERPRLGVVAAPEVLQEQVGVEPDVVLAGHQVNGDRLLQVGVPELRPQEVGHRLDVFGGEVAHVRVGEPDPKAPVAARVVGGAVEGVLPRAGEFAPQGVGLAVVVLEPPGHELAQHRGRHGEGAVLS